MLTFQEVKIRLEKIQKALESLQIKERVLTANEKQQKAQLISLRETLENKLNILTEMDKGVIHTDDEKKAKDLADQGVQVKLLKKGETLDTGKIKEAEEGLQFNLEQTKAISKDVSKAVATALKEEGLEIASGKIIRLEPMAFDVYFQYKDGKEDEFSFHIDQDKYIVLSDFTFTEKIGQVGLKGAGTPHVNVDVIKNNLLKVWAKLDGNMQEDAYDPTQIYGKKEEPKGDLMQQLEQALKSHDWYYMMSDDHRYYTRGSQEARNIHNLITKLKEAGQGEQAEALYKSYHEKNRVQETSTNEASIGSIQKKHGELVAKMKSLAAQYKGGDQSVIPQLKAMTIEKKKLEAELEAKVAGTGADQELDANVTEAEKAKKDFDKDGDVESPEAEYKGVKDKAIKKATSKTEAVKTDYQKRREDEDDYKTSKSRNPKNDYTAKRRKENPKEAVKAKKDFDKDGDVESPEAEYKGVKDKAIKKAVLKEDWGSSDQGVMNRAIHKDLGEPENMPMPFDSAFESAVEEAVDFYWDEWEEYQTDREGLIDHAKRAYYRAYFPEKFAGFQKMFSEGAVQSIADLEAIANDTSKTPKERDEARQKAYALKKPSRGTKLAEALDYTLQDEIQELIEDMDLEEYENFAYNNDIDPNDANEMQNFITSLSDAEAEAILKQYGGTNLAEAPEGTYYIEVSIRDAKRALEIIHDNPAYRKAVEMDGSTRYYINNPELAYDLQMDFGTQNIEVVDTNVDMDEAKHETELVQDPNSKEFTRKMKMTPKDMETIKKVQNMMAKEKSMKKEGEEEDYYEQNDTAVDINGKAYSIGDIIDFKGQMFQAQIGPNGRVLLQHLDAELQPKGTSIEGGDPKFQAILRNSVIVDTHKQIDEGGNNPEGDAMVLRFLKGLTKKWDIPMQHAVYFVQASIKRQGY